MRFVLQDERLIPTFSVHEGLPISQHQTLPHTPLNKQFNYSTQLQQHLYGKELLLAEIPFPLETLHEHVNHGYVQLSHGITKQNYIYICKRCGSDTQSLFASFACSRCGEDHCHYCRNCIMMGRVSECTPFYRWVGPEITEKTEVLFDWEGELSQGQAYASKEVVTAIQGNRELLVWAVCGAGKTEVLFKGLEYSLLQGKRVCIATPRTDVVLELTPRLKKVFPNTKIAALYGGSEDRQRYANLYISTTHQLLRFKEAFDVIIVDEVDAFPYSMDKSLQYAVQKARKQISSLIYLTATPSKQWKKEVQQNKRQAVKIPARYHGHPLPVPTFIWCGNWQKRLKKKTLPQIVLKWLENQLNSKKQAFLFVPSVAIIDNVVDICRHYDERIEGVHAEDKQRKEKVQRFRNGEIPIIVTSTILERGVTIPNSDVAVLGSEDDIFTESALVQIAGRVGRSAKYPTGAVLFFHFGKTKAMVEARKNVKQMNEMARKSMETMDSSFNK
ncbi:DEAD/DEAH box helicase [Metabacillus malikii]|uniref:Competence protein ComFA n=1 Tax=Metabacillus malikii TaxID=1504265 RepID=A0ABT9ZGN0_9BACI|nr:DEAD/DEAH box helicase [Metabacillus malikii]MDQ0231446.1 competence protein ComFA [Metabacillus malikii]